MYYGMVPQHWCPILQGWNIPNPFLHSCIRMQRATCLAGLLLIRKQVRAIQLCYSPLAFAMALRQSNFYIRKSRKGNPSYGNVIVEAVNS